MVSYWIFFQISLNLIEKVETENVELILTKTGCHRMSSHHDLKLLEGSLEKLLDVIDLQDAKTNN